MLTCKRFLVGALVGAIALATGACGGDDDDDAADTTPPTVAATSETPAPAGDTASASVQTFVGKVEGTTANLAIFTEGGVASAFFCDSAELWGFLDGTLSGSTITASEPLGDTLEATIDGTTITGTITIDGEAHSFTTESATGDAGAFADEIRTGDQVETHAWVQANDGSVTGLRVNVDLAPLRSLPGFTRAELAQITEILNTGVVAGVPLSLVPGNAPPVTNAGGPVRCGIAAFRFKRAQNAFNHAEAGSQAELDAEATFNDALGRLNEACGTNLGN
jgi:hypothetical protein